MDAKAMLLRSMTSARKVPVTGVIVQRFSPVSESGIEIKIEQDGEGAVKFTTVYPQRMAGVVTLDDGVTWMTFVPADKRLIKQESPRAFQDNPAYQLALAAENYDFTAERSPSIAERRVVCVVASPKHKELDQRRYYLDARTGYLMRIEKISPNADKLMVLDTRSIAFLETSPKLTLPPLPSDVRIITMRSPERLSPPSSGQSRVGFLPRTPAHLPLGFIVKETQLVGGGEHRFIAVRVSDGLAQGTVYQWDGSRKGHRFPFVLTKDFRSFGGIRLRMIGELPPKAADIVLDAFCK